MSALGNFSFQSIGQPPTLLARFTDSPNALQGQPKHTAHIPPTSDPIQPTTLAQPTLLSPLHPAAAPATDTSQTKPFASQQANLSEPMSRPGSTINLAQSPTFPGPAGSPPTNSLLPTSTPPSNIGNIPSHPSDQPPPSHPMNTLTRNDGQRGADPYFSLMEVHQDEAAWTDLMSLRQRFEEEKTELQRRHEDASRALQREKEQMDRTVALISTVFEIVEKQLPKQERRWAETKAKAERVASLRGRLHEQRIQAEQHQRPQTEGALRPEQSAPKDLSQEVPPTEGAAPSRSPPSLPALTSAFAPNTAPHADAPAVGLPPSSTVPALVVQSAAPSSNGPSPVAPASRPSLKPPVEFPTAGPAVQPASVQYNADEFNTKREEVMRKKQLAASQEAQRIKAGRGGPPQPSPQSQAILLSQPPPAASAPTVQNVSTEVFQPQAVPPSPAVLAPSVLANSNPPVPPNHPPASQDDKDFPKKPAAVAGPPTRPVSSMTTATLPQPSQQRKQLSQAPKQSGKPSGAQKPRPVVIKVESSPEPTLTPIPPLPTPTTATQNVPQSDPPQTDSSRRSLDRQRPSETMFKGNEGDRSGRVLKGPGPSLLPPLASPLVLLPPFPPTLPLRPAGPIVPSPSMSGLQFVPTIAAPMHQNFPSNPPPRSRPVSTDPQAAVAKSSSGTPHPDESDRIGHLSYPSPPPPHPPARRQSPHRYPRSRTRSPPPPGWVPPRDRSPDPRDSRKRRDRSRGDGHYDNRPHNRQRTTSRSPRSRRLSGPVWRSGDSYRPNYGGDIRREDHERAARGSYMSNGPLDTHHNPPPVPIPSYRSQTTAYQSAAYDMNGYDRTVVGSGSNTNLLAGSGGSSTPASSATAVAAPPTSITTVPSDAPLMSRLCPRTPEPVPPELEMAPRDNARPLTPPREPSPSFNRSPSYTPRVNIEPPLPPPLQQQHQQQRQSGGDDSPVLLNRISDRITNKNTSPPTYHQHSQSSSSSSNPRRGGKRGRGGNSGGGRGRGMPSGQGPSRDLSDRIR